MEEGKGSVLCAVLILVIAIGTAVWVWNDSNSTVIEGKVTSMRHGSDWYSFNIEEESFRCSKEIYDQICVGSVIRFSRDGITNIKNFEIIENACA